MALKDFPLSLGLRDGAVVPLREVVGDEDFHGALAALRVLAAGRLDLVEEADGHAEAGPGLRPLDAWLGELHAVEDPPGPARVLWGNTRCSIGLCFEQDGG